MPADDDYMVFGEGLRLPLAELKWKYSRSGGPGGQYVNKVSTKVMLVWPVTTTTSLPEDVRERFLARYRSRISARGDLVLISQRTRSRQQNRQGLLERLRTMLEAVAAPPRRRRPTKPTRASRARRLAAKRHRAQTKQGRRAVHDE